MAIIAKWQQGIKRLNCLLKNSNMPKNRRLANLSLFWLSPFFFTQVKKAKAEVRLPADIAKTAEAESCFTDSLHSFLVSSHQQVINSIKLIRISQKYVEER